jgi:predicted O-methyltransferase YrrM
VKRNQTLHETLIPAIVEGIGAECYLELGTHENETIGKVNCKRRYGVDINPTYTARVRHYAMTTQHFIEKYADDLAPFDVVFIDADHRYPSVLLDFVGIWPHVADEGLVILHDTNPETKEDTAHGLCGDAWKMAERLVKEGEEAVTIPYHPGLTIVRKRKTWGP